MQALGVRKLAVVALGHCVLHVTADWPREWYAELYRCVFKYVCVCVDRYSSLGSIGSCFCRHASEGGISTGAVVGYRIRKKACRGPAFETSREGHDMHLGSARRDYINSLTRNSQRRRKIYTVAQKYSKKEAKARNEGQKPESF